MDYELNSLHTICSKLYALPQFLVADLHSAFLRFRIDLDNNTYQYGSISITRIAVRIRILPPHSAIFAPLVILRDPIILTELDYEICIDVHGNSIYSINGLWRLRDHNGVSVIRAIENRVAIVKAERYFSSAIIDPFGQIVQLGSNRIGNNLYAEVPISTPLKLNWIRQHMAYWIFIVIFAIFTALDIYRFANGYKY